MSKPLPFNVRAGGPRGAPMGRPAVGDPSPAYRPLRRRRVPLRPDGYDRGGAYWGQRPAGVMLFCVFAPDRSVIRYLDAPSYLLAQERVRASFPQADFL